MSDNTEPITKDQILDSRDIIARIEYLEERRDEECNWFENNGTEPAWCCNTHMYDGTGDYPATGEHPEDCPSKDEALDEDEREELEELTALAKEGENYAPDWQYGETMIRDDYFTEYAEELAEDLGYLNREARWPSNHIDWEAAAEELKEDCTEVQFGSETYWLR